MFCICIAPLAPWDLKVPCMDRIMSPRLTEGTCSPLRWREKAMQRLRPWTVDVVCSGSWCRAVEELEHIGDDGDGDSSASGDGS